MQYNVDKATELHLQLVEQFFTKSADKVKLEIPFRVKLEIEHPESILKVQDVDNFDPLIYYVSPEHKDDIDEIIQEYALEQFYDHLALVHIMMSIACYQSEINEILDDYWINILKDSPQINDFILQLSQENIAINEIIVKYSFQGVDDSTEKEEKFSIKDSDICRYIHNKLTDKLEHDKSRIDQLLNFRKSHPLQKPILRKRHTSHLNRLKVEHALRALDFLEFILIEKKLLINKSRKWSHRQINILICNLLYRTGLLLTRSDIPPEPHECNDQIKKLKKYHAYMR